MSTGHLNSSAKCDRNSSARAGDSWTKVLMMETMWYRLTRVWAGTSPDVVSATPSRLVMYDIMQEQKFFCWWCTCEGLGGGEEGGVGGVRREGVGG